MTKKSIALITAIAASVTLSACGEGPGSTSGQSGETGWRWSSLISRDRSAQSRQSASITITMPLSYLVATAVSDWLDRTGYQAIYGMDDYYDDGLKLDKVNMDNLIDEIIKADREIAQRAQLAKVADARRQMIAKGESDIETKLKALYDSGGGAVQHDKDKVKRATLYAIALEGFRPKNYTHSCNSYRSRFISAEFANLLFIDLASQLKQHYADIDDFRRNARDILDAYPIDRLMELYYDAANSIPNAWNCDESDVKIFIFHSNDPKKPVKYSQTATGWLIQRYGTVVFGDGKIGGSEYRIAFDNVMATETTKRQTQTQSTETGGASKSDATAPAK